jgi:hypothetical protein
MGFTIARVATSAGSLLGLVLDPRMLDGSPIWLKPLKFSVSLGLYTLTLTWFLSLLPATGRAARLGHRAGTVAAAASAGELLMIVFQTTRGRRSHFNNETPFDSAVFQTMAVTVTVLWLATLVVAVLLLRHRLPDPALTWSIRLGMVLSLVGMALALFMTEPTAEQLAVPGRPPVVGAHSVGVPDGGPSMPVTGWSTTGGDLRIPHFVGVHAMQLVPLFLLALTLASARLPRLRDRRTRVRLVVVFAAVYAALLALLTRQALAGLPLLRPDTFTLTGLALTVVAAAAGALISPHTTAAGGHRTAPEPALEFDDLAEERAEQEQPGTPRSRISVTEHLATKQDRQSR